MIRTKKKPVGDLAVIKKDIQAIKKRLDNTATKDDLRRFATKDDLKDLAVATKKDFADVMWELKNIREDNAVLADMKRQVNEHDDRIEIIEEKLNLPLPA